MDLDLRIITILSIVVFSASYHVVSVANLKSASSENYRRYTEVYGISIVYRSAGGALGGP